MTAGATLTVVGEALVDLVTGPGRDEPAAYPGGSSANVALGLARLGHHPVLITQLGADRYGRLVREHLDRDGVRVVDAGPDGAPTSTATAVLDAAGVAAYEFDLTWRVADLATAAGSRALHVGSLGLTLEPGAGAVLDLARRVSAAGEQLVSYDPNLRPALIADMGVTAARVDEVAGLADVVKLSLEDLELLTGDHDPEKGASRWLHPGGRTQLVVVTLGADGACAATRHRTARVRPFDVPTADTVGAGDTFTAGLLAALAGADGLSPATLPGVLAGDRLDAVLETAAAAAALTCSRPGADPPTAAELADFLAARA